MINFKDVNVIYPNGAHALKDVSFNINKGEFVYLVGHSGSGKSTMLRLLLKEITQTSGDINILGKDLKELNKQEIPFYRRKLGIVFQDFRLLPNKTVFENVSYALKIVQADEEEINEKTNEVLKKVGLLEKKDVFPHELSGGQQQRVGIARAIINNPDILICDEPTGNLDPKTTVEIMDILFDINSNDTTVLMATHDQHLVNDIKKRVIVLDNGVVVRDDEKGGYNYEG